MIGNSNKYNNWFGALGDGDFTPEQSKIGGNNDPTIKNLTKAGLLDAPKVNFTPVSAGSVPEISDDVINRLIKPDPVAQLRLSNKTNTQPNTVTTTLEVVPDPVPVVSRSVVATEQSFFSKHKTMIIVAASVFVIAASLSVFFALRHD